MGDENLRRAADQNVFIKIATLEESMKGLVSAINEGREETTKIWHAVNDMASAIQKQNEAFLRAGKPEWRTLIGAIGLLMAVLVPLTIFLINQNVGLNTLKLEIETNKIKVADVATVTDKAIQNIVANSSTLQIKQIQNDAATDENQRHVQMLWKKVFDQDLIGRK